jgi:hypothetical protein
LDDEIMDKDRVEGSAKEIKGKTKEVAGKVLGDAKLESPMLRTVVNRCRNQCQQLAKYRD